MHLSYKNASNAGDTLLSIVFCFQCVLGSVCIRPLSYPCDWHSAVPLARTLATGLLRDRGYTQVLYRTAATCMSHPNSELPAPPRRYFGKRWGFLGQRPDACTMMMHLMSVSHDPLCHRLRPIRQQRESFPLTCSG